LVAGSLALSACTSGSTSSDATADSTTTSPTATASSPPPPDPAAPTDVETRDDTRSVAEKLADASVEARVKRALVREASLRVFPFRPNVVDGHLVLRGDVNTPDQYNRAERIAGRVEGVRALTNRLTMGGRPVTEARLADAETTPSQESTAVYHTVRQGDTLWDIARQYGASIQQIKNLNDLRSNNLRPGQRIRVR
jgi:osmotically-inducible protein OsmY